MQVCPVDTNNVLRETWEPDDDEAVGGRGQVETRKGIFTISVL